MEKGNLALQYKGRKINAPITFITKGYITAEVDNEDESEFEYEDEDDLFESSIYYSDNAYSSEDDEDLEFNPWKDYTPPSSEESEQEEVDEEGDNPAVYLANVVTQEEAPPLNLEPLDHHQQQSFKDLLQAHRNICAKSQTEIG